MLATGQSQVATSAPVKPEPTLNRHITPMLSGIVLGETGTRPTLASTCGKALALPRTGTRATRGDTAPMTATGTG